MASTEKVVARNYRISVTQGIGGYFAVMLADYEDMGWNTDVVISGVGRYRTRSEAIAEAMDWAKTEDLPYVG